MALGAITAAIAAIAGLAGKASRDAADANRQKAQRAAHKQQVIADILQQRAAAGGVDTTRSQMAQADNDFENQLMNSRRDTSGDMVPIVNALGTIAGDLGNDISKAPKAATPTFSHDLDPYTTDDNDPAVRSLLMRIAKERNY